MLLELLLLLTGALSVPLLFALPPLLLKKRDKTDRSWPEAPRRTGRPVLKGQQLLFTPPKCPGKGGGDGASHEGSSRQGDIKVMARVWQTTLGQVTEPRREAAPLGRSLPKSPASRTEARAQKSSQRRPAPGSAKGATRLPIRIRLLSLRLAVDSREGGREAAAARTDCSVCYSLQ